MDMAMRSITMETLTATWSQPGFKFLMWYRETLSLSASRPVSLLFCTLCLFQLLSNTNTLHIYTYRADLENVVEYRSGGC